MTRLLLAFPLLLAAGCATSRTPYAPVRDVAYQAMGTGGSAWLLVIGDDRIIFRPGGGAERSWPRVLPRTVDGVRIWQSGAGPDGITVTARPGPCNGEGQGENLYNYEHSVTVRLGEGEYRGCGGRLLSGDRR
jgi:uncharacterized membrane protein